MGGETPSVQRWVMMSTFLESHILPTQNNKIQTDGETETSLSKAFTEACSRTLNVRCMFVWTNGGLPASECMRKIPTTEVRVLSRVICPTVFFWISFELPPLSFVFPLPPPPQPHCAMEDGFVGVWSFWFIFCFSYLGKLYIGGNLELVMFALNRWVKVLKCMCDCRLSLLGRKKKISCSFKCRF